MSLLSTALLLAAVNFFPNPGFETWDVASGYPTADSGRWRVQHAGEKGFTELNQSSSERHSGEFSMHIRDANAGSLNHTLTYQLGSDCAKACRGKVLRASCWIKVISSSSDRLLNITLSAGGGRSKERATSAISPVAFGTNGWVRVTTKIRVPADAAMASLTFNCLNGFGGTGEAYFDDVIVSLDPKEHGFAGYVPAKSRALHDLKWMPSVVDTEEEAAYRHGYRHQAPQEEDGRARPDITGGNFTVDGKPQHYLGVWIYNRTRIDWPNNALGIDHIAYKEPPGKKVFDYMGFNSAQISAAHSQIGAVVRGFPLLKPTKSWDKRDWKVDEADIGEYFRRFEDIPMTLDFAFGYHSQYPKEMHAKLDQHLESWHAFVPFCPECPEGDRYYTAYFLGGTRAAMRHGCNVFLYELFNESSYGCACRYNYEEFNRRMRARFGEIAKANARWGSDFDSWEELLYQADYHQYPGVWYDWCRFLGERYAEVLRHYQKVVRHVDRRKNIYFTEQEAGTPVNKPTMDYQKVAEALDVLAIEGGWRYGFKTAFNAANEMEGVVATGGSSHYYNCDWYQALSKGVKPIVNNEHYCTRLEKGERVPSKKTDYITSLWLEVMHGVSANYTYVWDKRSFEARTMEQAHENVRKPSYKSSSLLNPWNVKPEDLSAFKEFRDEFEPYREMVMPFPRVKAAKVGVVFAKASEIHKSGHLPAVKPTRPIPVYANARDLIMGDWYAAVLHALYPTRVVFAEDLSAEIGGDLQALVFPNAPSIEPEAVHAARQFAKRGGTVIAPKGSFAYDECMKPLHEDLSFVTWVEGRGDVVAALERADVARYAALVPTDDANRPFTGADVQICDRGARKLVCLADLNNPQARPALLKLTLGKVEAGRRYRVTEVVTKDVKKTPAGSDIWSAEDLARGIPLVVPPQERVLIDLMQN